jgi:hypothetical protein
MVGRSSSKQRPPFFGDLVNDFNTFPGGVNVQAEHPIDQHIASG